MLAPMRLRAALIGAAALLLGAREASAKPIFLVVEAEFEHASLVAEASVLDVEIADWMGRGSRPGRIRVRITSDPRRIYRGFARLGEEMEFSPPAFGPQSCTADLNRQRDSNRTVLLVVHADGAVRMAGEPHRDGYRVRGWCDYNACILRTGGWFAVAHDIKGTSRADVPRSSIEAMFTRPRRAFWARTTRFLSGERPRVDAATIERHVGFLASRDTARREAAHEVLTAHGALHVPTLLDAAARTRDPEVLRRLHHTLARLEPHVAAHRVARLLEGAPPAARAYVVAEGIAGLGGEAREHAKRHLRSLSDSD